MRKLNTGDVFKMFRIIKKANLKEEIKNFAEQNKGEKDSRVIGMRFALVLVDALGNEAVENDVCSFLAGVAEVKPEEIKTQSIEATISLISEIIEHNDIKSFFNSATLLMKD